MWKGSENSRSQSPLSHGHADVRPMSLSTNGDVPLHVRESEFLNPGNFFLFNPECWALESGKEIKEGGIPLTTGIQNPSFTDED